MKVTLPKSGQVAEFRDVFTRGDRMEALRGLKIIIQPDGTRLMDGTMTSDIAGRLIRSMLVSLSGSPPFSEMSEDLANRAMDALDDEDAETLEKAVGPWVARVMRRDQPSWKHVASGAMVQPQTAADEAKLAASGDFAREDEGPKPASAPTGISSSASPALPGPEATGS